MIRRESANGCLLFRQIDHALLSAAIARQIGNNNFDSLTDNEILGIASHDDGWHIHDDLPTLNQQSIPNDVFETPPALALSIWTESTRVAQAKSPLAGLLTSLHGLALSSTFSVPNPIGRSFDPADARLRYELNRFQHDQIEIQELLRDKLGLTTTRPLKLGLDEAPVDDREKRLTFAFRWLQAMDRLSLNLCFSRVIFARLEPIHTRPSAKPTSLSCRQLNATRWSISPWPFTIDVVQLQSPAIALDQHTFTSDDDLRRAITESAPITVNWELTR